MSTTTQAIPGYVTGTWSADPIHSEVGFSVRHMMVSKVRGKFTSFDAKVVTAENPLESTVTATVDLASIDTGQPDRDNHIRSADFFEVEANQTMTFASTGIRVDGDDYKLDGDLTLKGVTKPVTFDLEINGFGPDAYGGTRAGFSATTVLNRRDYGVDFNAVMETGGLVVADRVTVQLEIELVLDA